MAEAAFMPCVPRQSCCVMLPKEAGKEVGILQRAGSSNQTNPKALCKNK